MVQEEPITLIDDSGKKFSDTVGKSGRVFDVVSGSLNLGSSSPPSIDSRYTSAQQMVEVCSWTRIWCILSRPRNYIIKS